MMSTRLKTVFLAASLAILSIASSAAFAAQGAYVSGDVGHATFINMPTYGYSNIEPDTSSTAFRLAFGYTKDVNPDFGIGGELGYNHYGSATYNGTTFLTYNSSLEYKYSAIDLLAKFTWHAAKTFDVYGKVGIANEMVQVSGDSSVDNNSKALPEIGVGVSYFATEKLSLDLGVYRTQGDDLEFNYNDDNALPSIFTVLFGVSYYFG